MPTTAPEPPKPAGKTRRLSRLIVLTVAGLLLAAFLLPLAARQIIGAARLKTIAEQTLSEALGRRVTIEGDVTIVFAPWLSIRMGPLRVAEAPGFGDAPMLTVSRLEMTIRMLPLTRRIVSPGLVRVHDLHLHLRRDATGRGNWEGLTALAVAAAPEAPGWEFAPQPGDIRVENAAVDYRDAPSGRTMAIRDVQFKTGLGQPFSFSLSFRADGFLPDGQLECHVGGKASFDPNGGGLTLERTLVETGLTLERPLVAGGASPTHLVGRFAAAYDPAADRLAITELDTRLAGAQLTGTVMVERPLRDAKTQAALALTLDMNGAWREILGLVPAESPGNLVAAPAETSLEPAPDAPGEARLSADRQSHPDRAVLRLSASAEGGRIEADKLSLTLPQGRITGKGRFATGPVPSLDADLAAKDVNFDALPLPAGRGTWPWPLPWPTGGNFDARLELHHCRLAGQDIAEAHVTGRGQNGLLRLAPASVVLPGGVVSLDARFDAGLPTENTTASSLGLDIRATLQPRTGEPQSQLRLLGRLRAEGARGNLQAISQDPARALAVLGLHGLVPPGGPLELKSTFTLAPAVNRLVAKGALTGLEANLAGTTLRGQITYDAATAPALAFDLAVDSLDADRLGSLSALPATGTESGAGHARAEGKLRIDHLTARGLEARNLALGLNLADGKTTGTVTGGELFGGKLSGKIDTDPGGRVAAALQLAGVDARRLPGSLGLSGTLHAKADLEAALGGKNRPAAFSATLEATAPQLHALRGGKTQTLASPKAVLTVKARRAGTDGLDVEGNLVADLASGFGLHEAHLAASGPVSLDGSGRLRDNASVKLEGASLVRFSDTGKPVKTTLAGQLVLETDGGFTAKDLRLDAGGLTASLKLARKSADGATSFALDTGPVAPRTVLADWGVALPAGLAADRLTKASASLSGVVTGNACDLKRLALSVDDSTVTGSASLPGCDPKRGKWDLRLDRLDCDAYFPHQPSSGPPPLAERRKPLDLRVLRELALEAKAQIGWLKKGNVVFDATTITAGAKGGQFTYRQESPHFYGGRFSADIRGDARDTALKTLVELKLESIEIARFLREWAEGDTLDSGAATFILAARTSGENEEELRGNLAGNASLQITRGALKVREPGAKAGEQTPVEKLPFDIFSSSWQARGGVAHTDDFRIDSPRMRVTGKGFVDLRDETINLSLLAALTGGGEVPATIIGPLDGPKLTIDRSKMLGDMVYRVLQGIVSIPGKAVTRILQIR